MGKTGILEDAGLVRVGKWLAQHFSLRTLRRLARLIGATLGLFQSSRLMRSIKVNQYVVTGETYDKKKLVAQSKVVIRNIVLSHADFYYYYVHPDEGKAVINVSPAMKAALQEIMLDQKPMVLVGPHMGNFDFLGMSMTWLGLDLYVLSYPNPNEAYQAQNEMRGAIGMEMHPISLSALRGAKKALKAGKVVVTGIDRPLDDPDSKYKPRFFGRPAALPTLHARLALEEGAGIRVVAIARQLDGTYYIDCSDLIPLETRDDLMEENLLNVEKILKQTEYFISKNPTQWAMVHTVWPEVLPIIKKLS